VVLRPGPRGVIWDPIGGCDGCGIYVYIYEMWLPLAIKITALDPTPLDPLAHAQGTH
jgi:hypothetical protein